MTARALEGRANFTEYLRAEQWKRMVSTGDRWPAFCQAVRRHAQTQAKPAAPALPLRRRPDRADADAPDPLGGPGLGVPAEVHAQMRILHAAGGVPATTPQQRKRNRRSSDGMWYGVPTSLKLALRYGYIGPNLPPRLGMAWVGRRGACPSGGTSWSLAPKGG